jgi:streptomycin 6-kinase
MRRLRAEFGGGVGPFPPRLVEQAERLFAELLGSMETPVLLHGDLHHWNILAADRRPWLAIDPKGVVGEPAYEVGALLRNKLDVAPNISRLTMRRIDQLAEALGFDRQRLVGWCLAQAVLSAWWSYEDHGGGWEEMVEFAEMLDGLMG